MGIDTSSTILGSLRRVNLISGKGGVGRTTIASTLARASAKDGKKTLLLEIEDDSGWDSPLAGGFGMKHFKADSQLLEPGLYGMRLSSRSGQERFLTSFLKVGSLSQMVLGNQGIKWFLEGAPAFREMGYFYHLLLQLRSDYERIILDLPATGHFLGLARLPNLILKLIPFGPIAERMREGQGYLHDPAVSAAFIVTLPQDLPVSEAVELKTEISKEAIPLGGFILNRAPFNPFTGEEEQILFALSQKSKTSKLLIELERIKRFREAGLRLKEAIRDFPEARVWTAPEIINPSEGLSLAQRIVPA